MGCSRSYRLIPTWDSERLATLSRPILMELLRGSMNFEGLIVTDALVRGAIANHYGTNEAPVMPRSYWKRSIIPLLAERLCYNYCFGGHPFWGSAGLLPVAEQWFKSLLRNNNLQALIIYGSPEVGEPFLPELPMNTPYVFSYGQMLQSQAIALEVLFRNHSPD